MKIIALCCFRNASGYLGEFLAHLAPHVDGFLFLDDRSNKSEAQSARELIGDYPKATTLINRAGRTSDPFAYETRNRAILLREAIAEGATHVLCLDADERLEKRFLDNIRNICQESVSSHAVRVRDLWNSTTHYRIDPPWCHKSKSVLFDIYESIRIPSDQELHQEWLESSPEENEPVYNLYHLGSLTAGLRAERVRRHEAADPERRYQPDYKYLNDSTNLKLEAIPDGRNWH